MTEESARDAKLVTLARLKAMGEKAHEDMYEAETEWDVSNFYRVAKDCFYDAMQMARELGLPAEAQALAERLHHIREEYRNQFAE